MKKSFVQRLFAACAFCFALGAQAKDEPAQAPLTVSQASQPAEAVRSAWVPAVIGVHTFSVHSNHWDAVAGRDWNSSNLGMYARWDNGIVVGTYYNSIRRQSAYAGWVWPLNNYIDIVVGGITGYDRVGSSSKPVIPMLVPTIHVPLTQSMDARVMFLPKAEKRGAAVVHFTLEFKL
jgi:hypothetical protein